MAEDYGVAEGVVEFEWSSSEASPTSGVAVFHRLCCGHRSGWLSNDCLCFLAPSLWPSGSRRPRGCTSERLRKSARRSLSFEYRSLAPLICASAITCGSSDRQSPAISAALESTSSSDTCCNLPVKIACCDHTKYAPTFSNSRRNSPPTTIRPFVEFIQSKNCRAAGSASALNTSPIRFASRIAHILIDPVIAAFLP